MRMQFPYSVSVSSTMALGAGVYVIKANDLYDPDYTGVGAQSVGFDQMSSWYSRFYVTTSSVSIVISNSSSMSPLMCCLAPSYNNHQ